MLQSRRIQWLEQDNGTHYEVFPNSQPEIREQ